MLPASFAADVPVFIATPTSACASAGASLVPSPVIATRLPPACSRLMSSSLSSGVASARKSSTPASAAIAFAVSGLSPVIMTVRMPIARSSANRSRRPALTMSLRWTTPSTRASPAAERLATTSGVPPDSEISVITASSSVCTAAGTAPTHSATLRAGALAQLRAVGEVDTAHAGLGRERHDLGIGRAAPRPGRTPCARSTIEVPSGVGSASEESCAARASSSASVPPTGTNSVARRLP